MSADTLGSVFVLGAGPVATALVRALHGAGQTVALWARSPEAARTAIGSAAVPSFSEKWPSELAAADTLIFAVRDDAIRPLAEELAADGMLRPEMCVVHCAGSQPSERAFGGLEVAGRGLCHPLRAIAKGVSNDLGGTTFGVEGDARGRDCATQLVAALGGKVLPLEAEQMPAYHAAAAIASNYLVAVLELAGSVLGAAGIPPEVASQAFAQLAAGAVANVEERGPAGLTGPIRRGDADTVRRHLEALAQGPAENLEAYRLLGRRCLAIAAGLGDAPTHKLHEIAALLRPPKGRDPAES